MVFLYNKIDFFAIIQKKVNIIRQKCDDLLSLPQILLGYIKGPP